MSLINQMLHDLDQRRGGVVPAEQRTLLGLTAAGGVGPDRGRGPGTGAMVAAVCVAAAVAWGARGWLDRGAGSDALATVVAADVPPTMPPAAVEQVAPPAPAALVEAGPAVPAPALTGGELEAPRQPEPEPLIIPEDFALTEAVAAAPPVEHAGTFRRTPAKAVGAADSNALVRALRLIEAGDLAAGSAGLEAFLAARPDHVIARHQLAQARLQAGDRAAAAATLRAGLARQPDEARFAEMLAHLLVDEDDIAGALAVLAAAAPPIIEGPAYHAFMAALIQRSGAHAQAATAYRRVLAVEPGKGAWWIGLGISLSRLDDGQGAAAAFGQALQDPALSSNMQAYAGEQLRRLRPQG